MLEDDSRENQGTSIEGILIEHHATTGCPDPCTVSDRYNAGIMYVWGMHISRCGQEAYGINIEVRGLS